MECCAGFMLSFQSVASCLFLVLSYALMQYYYFYVYLSHHVGEESNDPTFHAENVQMSVISLNPADSWTDFTPAVVFMYLWYGPVHRKQKQLILFILYHRCCVLLQQCQFKAGYLRSSSLRWNTEAKWWGCPVCVGTKDSRALFSTAAGLQVMFRSLVCWRGY